MRLCDLLCVSENAIRFLNENIKPLVAPDYIGWFMPLPPKFKCTFVVDYSEDNEWDLIPTDPKKKLKPRKIEKAINFLIQKGWIENITNQPFKEFSPKLEVDIKNSILLSAKEAATEEEINNIFPAEPLNYDDDISGITYSEE